VDATTTFVKVPFIRLHKIIWRIELDRSSVLKGRVALVTGGTSGIGYYTASALAGMGATVYITGRDVSRGKEAERQMRVSAGHENVQFVQADASTVGGNQKLAQHLDAVIPQLHILVNNVGGLYNDRWETEDGYEATLAMNLVGPFALTEALLPTFLRSAPARIVNLSSAGYSMWKGDLFADIHSMRAYNGSEAYARSKYLNIVWTFALARSMESRGIVVNAVHPGTAWTAQTRGSEARVFPAAMRPFWPILRLIQRMGSPEKAATTSIYLASSPEAADLTGEYFENSTRPKGMPHEMLDPAIQEQTCELAASLVRNAPTAIPKIEAEAIM
jgi:NAD(P)-dependent dehydrogenase (short-subunit alcohol dehydrogenase family)